MSVEPYPGSRQNVRTEVPMDDKQASWARSTSRRTVIKRIGAAVGTVVGGLGGPLNVYRAVQKYERAGAGAVMIEDLTGVKHMGRNFPEGPIISKRHWWIRFTPPLTHGATRISACAFEPMCGRSRAGTRR